jgi:ubiquinone/menaquinone biosynthesis C-methylase UbiE
MDRRAWFAELRRQIRGFYLSDRDNPYRLSGRSTGKERWELKRRCIADAIHAPGDFMDIGCANGLLLETLRDWTPHELTPHGIDFVAELIDYARARHPGFEANFCVANVWDWEPEREYDFVRTNLEYVPAGDWPEYLRRVARPARRIIVCHYVNPDEQLVDCAQLLERNGFPVAGASTAPNVSLAWADR